MMKAVNMSGQKKKSWMRMETFDQVAKSSRKVMCTRQISLHRKIRISDQSIFKRNEGIIYGSL